MLFEPANDPCCPFNEFAIGIIISIRRDAASSRSSYIATVAFYDSSTSRNPVLRCTEDVNTESSRLQRCTLQATDPRKYIPRQLTTWEVDHSAKVVEEYLTEEERKTRVNNNWHILSDRLFSRNSPKIIAERMKLIWHTSTVGFLRRVIKKLPRVKKLLGLDIYKKTTTVLTYDPSTSKDDSKNEVVKMNIQKFTLSGPTIKNKQVPLKEQCFDKTDDKETFSVKSGPRNKVDGCGAGFLSKLISFDILVGDTAGNRVKKLEKNLKQKISRIMPSRCDPEGVLILQLMEQLGAAVGDLFHPLHYLHQKAVNDLVHPIDKKNKIDPNFLKVKNDLSDTPALDPTSALIAHLCGRSRSERHDKRTNQAIIASVEMIHRAIHPCNSKGMHASVAEMSAVVRS